MDKKNVRLTFYVVCGLLLGAPYIIKLIKLVPEILKTIPNAAEILAASGYAVLVIASMAVAFKLGEALWIRIVSIYSAAGLAVAVLTMMTSALGATEIFDVLFELICAPFYGINSPISVTVLMLVLVIISNLLLNKMSHSPANKNSNT